jgi:AAA family ATP:ADP antiporter
VRHSLFLVTDREAKYKAKTFIDTLMQRMGDVLAAGCVWAGSALALNARAFALLNVGLVGLWLAVAWAIGRRYEDRAEPAARPAPRADVVAAKVGA